MGISTINFLYKNLEHKANFVLKQLNSDELLSENHTFEFRNSNFCIELELQNELLLKQKHEIDRIIKLVDK